MWWAGLLLLVVVAGAGRLPASGDIVIGSRVKNQAVSQDEGSHKENLPPNSEDPVWRVRQRRHLRKVHLEHLGRHMDHVLLPC